MRIAVCDNDEKIQDWMKQTIKRYFQKKIMLDFLDRVAD